MEQKNLVATIYLHDGYALTDPESPDSRTDAVKLAQIYNDSGIDKLLLLDLSEDVDEREKNIHTIRQINRSIDIKTCGGGGIKRLNDIRRFFYVGCEEVILNGDKPETPALCKEACEHFGSDKLLVSLDTVDFIFKTRDFIKDTVHELLIMDESLVTSIENMTDIPYLLKVDDNDLDHITDCLRSDLIRGIYGRFLNDTELDIMQLKATLSDRGISMDNFEPKLLWSDLKVNSDGLVPVVVQDYQTNLVYMVAYMNEEAFNTTIRIGKMTYWSRSRQELWIKGMTSGHVQYVKSLTADCDYDTILAKVSQVGGIACHTGAQSCFFNEIVKKEFFDRSPQNVMARLYDQIRSYKADPEIDSFTNTLYEQGLDAILTKFGSEMTELIIAEKGNDKQKQIQESADIIYYLMMLMIEKGITWEDVTMELSQR